MYLSKVLLQPQRLNNAWEWHRALWTLFPDIESGQPLPCLYRIESLNLDKGAQVLMQSELTPIQQSSKASVLAQKEFEPQLIEGQLLRFSLKANPTKKIRDKTNPDRKIRVPLIKEEDQQIWIQRKFEDAAVILSENMLIQNHPPTYFRKGRRGGKIVSTSFEGLLEVKSPDEVKVLLKKGIGSGKSFGCGLVLIRRA